MKTILETWPAEASAPERHDGPVFMQAELAPNRSLANPAFIALMIAIGTISFTAGIFYLAIGAWPVLPFFGLDVFLVWLAFRISYRDGRAREFVRVDGRDIEVVRQHPTGHRRRYRLPTAWVRLRLVDPQAHHAQVALVAHGKALVLGQFLSPPERGEFATALGAAIERARQSWSGPQEPGGADPASA
ncbi:DUF2244 domain-containing protein [Maricaulis sp.]|uniref:DUF2244 domain-containing protein n=1 Tax=Maricaulis sp. TaxID=1486257 RepID=UPI0025BC3FA4|nr:DUF2244 domain-containing protein [Maricaulis sp.]